MLALQETIRPWRHGFVSLEQYERMKARIELFKMLSEAEDDVKNGRLAPVSATFDDLRKML